MPWLLREDAALKAKLQQIVVSDRKNAMRPVRVFYGLPDREMVPADYPFMTISLINISEATERAHRGRVTLPYIPEGHIPAGADFTGPLTEFPIPMNIDYQITTWARMPQHDRELITEMFKITRSPTRFGYLEEPIENTIRRLDFLGFAVGDTTDENNKRVFKKFFTIRVSSELLLEEISNVRNVNAVLLTTIHTETGEVDVYTSE